jgi:hypothetical protein
MPRYYSSFTELIAKHVFSLPFVLYFSVFFLSFHTLIILYNLYGWLPLWHISLPINPNAWNMSLTPCGKHDCYHKKKLRMTEWIINNYLRRTEKNFIWKQPCLNRGSILRFSWMHRGKPWKLCQNFRWFGRDSKEQGKFLWMFHPHKILIDSLLNKFTIITKFIA